MHADSGKQSLLAEQAGVGCAIEFDQLLEFLFIGSKPRQHRAFGTVHGWNQAVRVCQQAIVRGRKHQAPRRASRSCRTWIIPGNPMRRM
jgi:hypothetical protein